MGNVTDSSQRGTTTDIHSLESDTLPEHPHTESREEMLSALQVTRHGLERGEAKARLDRYGRNTLPMAKPQSLALIFLHQFTSPLIYVLLTAAVFSIVIQEWSDAGFIAAVLLINAIIGTYQERSAQRAAEALRKFVTARSRVLRDGEIYLVNAEEVVPGDIVLLESGDKIPADMRMLECHDFEVDESLLTGESLPVLKDEHVILNTKTSLGDRINMAFAGTMVGRGRARGVVVDTGLATFLGRIASDVLFKPGSKAPLQIRMDKFVHRVAIFVLAATIIMFSVAVIKGLPWSETFLLAVALAVSVIPEGLPVALTVALAIGMHRMAKRNVIVRRLLAVEALGSCTFIATDKTGTLTVNQLTVTRINFANGETWSVSGEGMIPEGTVLTPRGTPTTDEQAMLERLCQTAILTNEAFLGRSGEGWSHQGDAVDVSLLVMAHKIGLVREEAVTAFPYESEQAYSASLHRMNLQPVAFVKGALEKLLPMCTTMAMPGSDTPIDAAVIEVQANALASEGYRVLALASGSVTLAEAEVFSEEHLKELTGSDML